MKTNPQDIPGAQPPGRRRGRAASGPARAGGVQRWAASARRAFTLLEMLTVIAIIGILAAIVGPTLGNFKPNAVAAATEQLLTDIGRARQLAMSQHTTVYMVFVPPGFALDQACLNLQKSAPLQWSNAETLLDKQYTSYNFVSLRSVGDQPGRHTPRYWSSWKTLPDGIFIATNKFSLLNQTFFSIYTNVPGVVGTVKPYITNVAPFNYTGTLPFPTAQAPVYGAGALQRWTDLPYIAFNYLGQLVVAPTETLRLTDEIIPLARGTVLYPHNPATKVSNPLLLPTAREVPPGNSTNTSFTLLHIDRLTGRTHVQRQEVQ